MHRSSLLVAFIALLIAQVVRTEQTSVGDLTCNGDFSIGSDSQLSQLLSQADSQSALAFLRTPGCMHRLTELNLLNSIVQALDQVDYDSVSVPDIDSLFAEYQTGLASFNTNLSTFLAKAQEINTY